MDEKESTVSLKKKDVPPRANRRKARKELAYVEPLEEPGTLYNAEVHGAAQRLLKVHRVTKYIKFCRCCSLPQETPGIVVPFNMIDKKMEFGIGIYLYFYYIKFALIMAIICIGLSSIPTIVFSKDYASEIKDYCSKYTNGTAVNTSINFRILSSHYGYSHLIDDCEKYVDYEGTNNTKKKDEDVFKADWLSDMSSYNIKSYYNVFKYRAEDRQVDNIDSVILDYSFMYFLTGITVLIANFLFVQIVELVSQYEDFKETSPGDYAVLVHGVPPPSNGGKMRDELLKIVDQVSQYTHPYSIHQIIPCLRFGEIYDIAKKKYTEETKIYHVYNFQKQIKLNKEKNYSQSQDNLHYFEDRLIFFTKSTPVKEIEKKIIDYQDKLNTMEEDLNNNPNNYNGGTFFLIFDTMKMKDEFVSFFPQTYLSKFIWSIRYFFENIICGCCMNTQQMNMSKLKLCLDITDNVEPYEIEWENMGYSRCSRNFRLLISCIAFIALAVITLLILIGLNALQRYIKKKKKDVVNYIISFIISIILAVINYVGKLLFKKLTFYEKIEIKTNYFISFSVKLTIFTFILIAVLPMISNVIFGMSGYDILVNNLFMIFITNIFLAPLFFYFGADLIIKILKRTRARVDLKDVKFEQSTYTQKELNEIFENPEMDISAKYSFVANVILISLFYMSIFPIGMIFGFGALILTYFLEFIYIGLYKRPEILNSRLCKFYVQNFKWSIFIFALGNYIFLGSLNENQRKNSWSLINLLVFFVLGLIPYQNYIFYSIGSEGEQKKDTYHDNFFYFSTDYEKLNPFTRRNGYINYFQQLIDQRIIDPTEGNRIINKVKNTNEITGYLTARRHHDNHCASQELNNTYMKNKNNTKIDYLFGNENKGLTIRALTTIIWPNTDTKEEKMTSKQLDEVRQMKDNLYEFTTTNTGICNALIFLDEKHNINDEYNNYNFNPWKCEWIYSPEYKMKRKDLIHKIRKSMDYRGEISDDEDSIVKYDEDRDDIYEKIKEMNDQILKSRDNQINVRDSLKQYSIKPIFDNKEIINADIDKGRLGLLNQNDYYGSNQKFNFMNNNLENNRSGDQNLTQTNLINKGGN